MDTKLFTLDQLDQAATLLKKGELIAFPTETVYGLGADATNEEAVKKVFWAKGRPSDNPLIIHVASKNELEKYVENFSRQALKLVNAFWPGPLTLILQVKEAIFAPSVTPGLKTVAVRMPDSQAALDLITRTGVPLAGPSANTSGMPSPTAAEHVYHDLQGKIAGILDGGETGVGIESTVLDMTDPENPVILRPGAVTKEAIEEVIGDVMIVSSSPKNGESPKSPGLKYKHYSPNEPVVIVDGNRKIWENAIHYYQKQGEKVGLLASDECLSHFREKAEDVFSLGNKANVSLALKRLYAGLRYFEHTDVTLILAEAYENNGLGTAYMNRLEKSAGNVHF